MYVHAAEIPAAFRPASLRRRHVTMGEMGATQADWERLCARSRLPRTDPNYRTAPNACAEAARLANPNPTAPPPPPRPAPAPSQTPVAPGRDRLAAADAARMAAEARANTIQQNNRAYQRVNQELRAAQTANQTAHAAEVQTARDAAVAAQAAQAAAAEQVRITQANNARYREVNTALRAENVQAREIASTVRTGYEMEQAQQRVHETAAQSATPITALAQRARFAEQSEQAPPPASPLAGSMTVILIAGGAILFLMMKKKGGRK